MFETGAVRLRLPADPTHREAIRDIERYTETILSLDDRELALDAAGALWDQILNWRAAHAGSRPRRVS